VGREDAFKIAAGEAGMTVQILREGPTAYSTGAAAARMLFRQNVVIDGAFCVTDLLACGFMDSARHEFGLQIPRDLCVVGFDDIEQAGWSSYNLTTFRQPIDQIADRIVTHLDRSRTVEGSIEVTCFHPVSVWRGSIREPLAAKTSIRPHRRR
jgi:DNA-binding LacI/PurR family transcriptional regulator